MIVTTEGLLLTATQSVLHLWLLKLKELTLREHTLPSVRLVCSWGCCAFFVL